VSAPLVNIYCTSLKDAAKKLSAGVMDAAKKFVMVSRTQLKNLQQQEYTANALKRQLSKINAI